MICTCCLRAPLRSHHLSSKTILRSLSTSTALLSTPAAPATSTGLAQPFSTPLTPAPKKPGTPQPNTAAKPTAIPVSSCPAGTPLRGINFLKGRDDPVALPEEDYPEWLWSVLDKRAGEGEEEDGAGDEFSKSAKLRRKAAKRARKLEAMRRAAGLAEPEIRVPLTQQSIDLPANEKGTVQGALEAEDKRDELRAAMRRERRKKIKETNFLKSM